MTDTVTRLIVRADGSLATLDRFEKGMGNAGKATDYASGAVASFEKRMEAARAATERGLAVSTQSVARKSQEERAWEKWSATVDRTSGLRIRLEREAATAAAAAANAVNMGYASQEQALNTLMALERRHTAQLSAHIAAENNVALAYNRTAQAADQAAMSTDRLSAANQNNQYRGAGNFNTGNVAAQFQDIGVTAAMGMSPIMIALQQGTQLSAVLGGQGLTGVVKTLGAAFAAVLSPVSLLTIGVVALAAWGIQAFMGMMSGADDAATALERHNELLDKTLEGYKAARDAAADVLDAQGGAPEASVVSDLSMFRNDALERYEETLSRVRAEQAAWQDEINLISQVSGPDELTSQMQRVLDIISEVGISTETSAGGLDRLHSSLTLIKNSGADDAVVAVAEAMLVMVEDARQGKAMVDSLGASLDALDRDIQIRINVSQVFSDAMSDINSLYVDPRNRFDQQREELDLRAQAAQNSAQTTSELIALASDYERVLSSINAAEVEANKKSDARGAKAANKPFDQWDGNVDQFQQRIASQRLEIELLGQSTYEIERQKSAFDLLNQAKQAGIPITSEVTHQINLMSSEYAASTVELQRMQEQQQRINQVNSTLASGFSDMFKGLLKGTTSLTDALGGLLGKLGDLFIDQAFNMLLSGGFGGGFGMGGGRGGLLGGMIIPGILHSGGTAGSNGYNHSRQFSPALWANAPRYHGGTDFAGLRPNEVPAILERGEKVIPANQNVASGGQSVVVIRLDDGLRAEIASEAAGTAVQITRGMVEPVSRAVDQMAQQQRYG